MRPRAKVDVDVGEMHMVEPGAESPPGGGDQPLVPPIDTLIEPEPPPPPAPPAAETSRDSWPIDDACVVEQTRKRDELIDGQRRITYVLIAVGLMLILGLAFYGIKMTHHVAGPLHKIGLYFAKMRDGKLDTVYNLRKGDQLTEFYEHFKHAHAGLRKMEEQDIARLEELIRVAEEAGLATRSPELAALLADLRTMLERKEKSLV